MEIKNGIVYSGSRAICGAVGLNWKRMSYYVYEKGLPAFKIDGQGTWIAIHEDLVEWIKTQRDENINRGI